MNLALFNSLTADERLFIDATSRRALARLDEEQALDLHERTRRMRDKYVSTYRRSAAAAVRERGGRGAAYAGNRRDRAKAEAFESALARVSRRLDGLARSSAGRLRAERIDAARGGAATTPGVGAAEPVGAAPLAARVPRRPLRRVHRVASLRSQDARRQQRRDARRHAAVRGHGTTQGRPARNRPVRQP